MGRRWTDVERGGKGMLGKGHSLRKSLVSGGSLAVEETAKETHPGYRKDSRH